MTEHIILFQSKIEDIASNFRANKEAAQVTGGLNEIVEILSKLISQTEKIITFANEFELEINYLKQFQNIFESATDALPFNGNTFSDITQREINNRRSRFSSFNLNLQNRTDAIEFQLDFFLKLGFFRDNVVAIGSNGSGKTSLSEKLKGPMENNGVVISAQKILFIPDFSAIDNPMKTAKDLKFSQTRSKSVKNKGDIVPLQNELSIVLKNLFADNNALSHRYRKEAFIKAEDSLVIIPPTKSNLDRTIEIWNSLIEHRTMCCEDGINLTLEFDSKSPYPIAQMSDGEKVLLFLVAQVLQAPENGFVIVDEPEMYLHKSILNKLWDCLERERSDCIFIYLTHDLDFAASRTDAKKLWIKSFSPPDNWEIEDIPENTIPESLIFELIGSRKNILFCEGEKNSLDEKIYNILFPHLTITPVGSCLDVISYTKAFNKIQTISTKALGLIDADHQPQERLEPLARDCIYNISLAEVENVLLDEEFLIKFSDHFLADKNAVKLIKEDVLTELHTHEKLQAANFVSSKVDYYFKDTNVKKGNSLEAVKANLDEFNSSIKTENWYQAQIDKISTILEEKDYTKAISIFNNKGLKRFAEQRFNVSDFQNQAIKFLMQSEDPSYLAEKYFPPEIYDSAEQNIHEESTIVETPLQLSSTNN